jgi:hypothetical protein
VIERTGLRPGDQLFLRLTDAGDIVIRPAKEREVHAGYAADDASPTFKHEALTPIKTQMLAPCGAGGRVNAARAACLMSSTRWIAISRHSCMPSFPG